MADAEPTFSVTATEEQTESHQWLSTFWPRIAAEIKATKQSDFKTQELPLARIKKIMKLDEDVKMISQEAPLLFAKAAEIFISELALRAWVQTEDSKRRTLQDGGEAVQYYVQTQTGLSGVAQPIQLSQSLPAGAQVVQVQSPQQTNQTVPTQIQLTPSQLQAIQQQIGSAQQIVVQSGGEQQQQVFTTNSGAQIQQVQFLQQS
ncbi:nuclear transcription factor Y subunit gamma-like isoform X3 [Watersipora subatra]|uniref:nuclear transcription factor Y subunit gamma-like isoform X3 n=1 Tax=Watersipora subatra TaxID=2589382 RepID=UPI00355BE778